MHACASEYYEHKGVNTLILLAILYANMQSGIEYYCSYYPSRDGSDVNSYKIFSHAGKMICGWSVEYRLCKRIRSYDDGGCFILIPMEPIKIDIVFCDNFLIMLKFSPKILFLDS